MPKITLGNTKIIENTNLKEVYPSQKLSISSVNKKFTRHYTNTLFYLNPTEKALFDWIIYYSSHHNTFQYSTNLLEVFKMAADKAIDLYKPKEVKFNTSLYKLRKAVIVLIEKGLIVRLSHKQNMFMINPYVVFSSDPRAFQYRVMHGKYLNVMDYSSIEELSDGLTRLCDEIYSNAEMYIINSNKRKLNKKKNYEI